MGITKIIVTDIIMTGNLFAEDGYDANQSADNLADLKGQIIVDYLEEKYPGAEIYADIAIQQEVEGPRPLEVLAYMENNETNPSESAAIQEQLCQRITEGTADYSWAVKSE